MMAEIDQRVREQLAVSPVEAEANAVLEEVDSDELPITLD